MIAYSIGHSNRSMKDFLSVLKDSKVKTVVDVRRFPGSRKWPWFSSWNLEVSLPKKGIKYLSLTGLGGRRKAVDGSKNKVWTVFCGYADYMGTEEFEKNLAKLIRECGKHRTAFMCSEAVPWRCHRGLISDALLAKGVKVKHIGLGKKGYYHELTAFGRIKNQRVVYRGKPGAPRRKSC